MTRIGSLCTGYAGLDMAVQAVFGGTVAWHCQYEPPDKDGREDKHQYAARILAHHWPHIPNHGDLTAVAWDQVEPVDVLTAGFPCQDVSLAGLRAGLSAGTRSGLWLHVARAIESIQPQLVVIENVRGLLSAKADSDVEPCTWCVGDAGGEPPLRALGAVLADLARLGFDAEWACVRASDVGAPHQRERVFLLAWPTDAQGSGCAGARLLGPAAERRAVVADADRVGSERDRAHGGRRDEPASHDLATADTDRGGRARDAELPAGRGSVQQRVRGHADGRDDAPANTQGDGRDEGRTESAGEQGGPDAPLSGEPDVQWGEYEPAVRRWERVLGRFAPPAHRCSGTTEPRLRRVDAGPPRRPRHERAGDPARRTAEGTRQRSRAAAGRRRAPAAGRPRRCRMGGGVVSNYTGATPDTEPGRTWLALANCHGQGDVMFPSGSNPAEIEEAKDFCRACPVIRECRQWALDTGPEYGIWGGLDEKERRALRRRRAHPIGIDDYTDTPRSPQRARTLEEAWTAFTRADSDHTLWTGPGTVHQPGNSNVTPNRLGYYIDRGRWPDSPVQRTCNIAGCVRHLEDTAERQRRTGTTKATV